MSGLAWLGLAAAGGVGSVARVALAAALTRRSGTSLPVGTLAVNALGGLLLGLLAGASVGGETLFVVGTGALGAFTTFSTWMVETERLLASGARRLAALNVALPLVVGLAATGAGWAIGTLA